MKNKRIRMARLGALLLALLLLIDGTGLYFAGRYVSDKLLQSNEATAMDLALLIRNNFRITDEETAYMKTLTFNEMEVDPINRRLMDAGSGVALNAVVRNIYLLAPLEEDEVRRCPDEKTAEFLATPWTRSWTECGF
jgi:hypothetical protein